MPDNDDGTISLIYMTQICRVPCAVCRGKKDEKSEIGSRDDPVWSSQRECRRRRRRLHQLTDKQTINYRSNNRSLIATDPDTGDPMQIQYNMLHSISISNKRLECFVLFPSVFFKLTLLLLLLFLDCCCFSFRDSVCSILRFLLGSKTNLFLAIVQCNLHYVLVSI